MALLNITQAAKAAGITRQYLHTYYIKKGKITVTQDNMGKPFIDTSEIIRVFGNIQLDDNKAETSLHNVTHEDTIKIMELEHTIKVLEERLRSKDDLLHEKEQRILENKTALLLIENKIKSDEKKEAPRKKFLGIF